jgi:hypothetical protein
MKFIALSLFFTFASLSSFGDLKVSNRTTAGGRTFDNTVLIKDGKMRSETPAGPELTVVTIQDCSTHRLIQINDRTRSYMELPLGDDRKASSLANNGAITLTIDQQDTGERKILLGYNARHIKGTMSAEGSASCAANMNATTDGWYIDLPEIHGCVTSNRAVLAEGNGCHGEFNVKSTGVEHPGFPVMVDTTFDSKGNASTIHQQTTAISTEQLDPTLFEVPAGYKKVDSYQALMGFSGGSYAGAVAGSPRPSPTVSPGAANTAAQSSKQVPRIGVAQVRSVVSQTLGTDGWQQELVNDIDFLGGKGVVLSSDPNDRDATLEEAKQRNCDYVVFTTVNNYKSVSVGQKIGSVLSGGGLGGVGGTGQGRVEISAQVEVFQPDNVTPILNGSDDFRQNDPDGTARGLMHTEARDVMLQIRKLRAQP